MKNILMFLNRFLQKHKDKVYHFLGCGVMVLLLSLIVPMNLAVFGSLLFGVGVEIGDLKNYGLKELKSKDKTRIQAYLKNTIGDLIADVFGILMVALIMGIISILGVRHGFF